MKFEELPTSRIIKYEPDDSYLLFKKGFNLKLYIKILPGPMMKPAAWAIDPLLTTAVRSSSVVTVPW